jgi:hypothetical protein
MSPVVLQALVAVVVGAGLGLATEVVRHRSNPSRLLLEYAIMVGFFAVTLVPNVYFGRGFWTPFLAAGTAMYAGAFALRWARRNRPKHRASRRDRLTKPQTTTSVAGPTVGQRGGTRDRP